VQQGLVFVNLANVAGPVKINLVGPANIFAAGAPVGPLVKPLPMKKAWPQNKNRTPPRPLKVQDLFDLNR
jgi:hypothetical protein